MQYSKFIIFLLILIAIGITLGTIFSFSTNSTFKDNYLFNFSDKSQSSQPNISLNSGDNIILPKDDGQSVTDVLNQETTETKRLSPSNISAIYLTGWSAGTASKRQTVIENLSKYGFNAVVIDIKDEAGYLSYNSSVQTALDISASRNMIKDISNVISDFHESNIYVIGRIVTFKDPLYAKKVSDIAYKKADDSLWFDYAGNNWPNPYNTDSWAYPIELAKEAATLGFDEIQFDYIRFPSSEGKTKNISYGFDSDTKTKAEVINSFLKKVMNELKDYDVTVSADVFGITTKKIGDFEHIGQDFLEISKIVDVVCPMIYPSHYGNGEYGVKAPDTQPYKIIKSALQDAKNQYNTISGDLKLAVIRPYLQDFTATWLKKGNYINYNTSAVTAQLQACYDLEIYDFTLWDPSNKYAYESLNNVIKTTQNVDFNSGDTHNNNKTANLN